MVKNILHRVQKNILLNRFVQLIEKNSQTITNYFLNDLLKNPDTPAYRSMDPERLYEASDMIYRDLSQWISKDFDKSKIRERYMRIGRERFDAAIPLSQVMKALVLQKRHLWIFVMDKLYDDKTAYLEAMELNNRVALYFDRAIFYVLKAYEEILYKRF